MTNQVFKKFKKITPSCWHWVWDHHGFKRYFLNTGWMFFGKFFHLLISFFVGVWIIRHLGPEDYGSLSYILAFTGIFSFLAGLGINNILNRELVNNPEKKDELLGTAFIIRIIGGSMALAASVIAIFIVEKSSLLRLLVSVYSFTFIIQSFNIIDTFFNSRVESKQVVKANVGAMSISAVLKIAFIFSHLGINYLVFVYLLDALWLSLFLLYFYRRRGFRIRDWSFNSSLAKGMLRDSWLLALTSASALIYMKIDQVMIRQMIDDLALGFYSASVKLSELSYMLPALISSSLMPAILNARKVNKRSYFYRLKTLSIFLLLLSLSISLIISLGSGIVIRVLFGPEYQGSIRALSIGAWSLVGISLGYIAGQYLIAENHIKIYFFSSFLGALINIALNFILIPKYGINGAAFSTVISYLLVPLFLFIFKKTRIDLKLLFSGNKE